MTKYAAITILIPVDDDHGRNVPDEWFSGVPKGGSYAADIVDLEKQDDVTITLYAAFMAHSRKIARDGFPA